MNSITKTIVLLYLGSKLKLVWNTTIINAQNAVIAPSTPTNSGLQVVCLPSYLIFKIKDSLQSLVTGVRIQKFTKPIVVN